MSGHGPIHASAVAVGDRAVLIMGPSGSGKSALALQLIALGANLISDDRTVLRGVSGILLAEAPKAIVGKIEARGVGLLSLPTAKPTPVAFAVDMSRQEGERLPYAHQITLEGITLPCLQRVDQPHFAAAILLCLRHGLPEPT